jgi:UDP-glucuronate decarboxylase
MAEFLLKSDIGEIINSIDHGILHQFSGKRILITGGCGFLGRYFVETFLQMNEVLSQPCELIVLDNLITAGEQGKNIGSSKYLAFVNHDIIKPFYPERPVDFIIHAAGIASPYYYRKYPLETLDVATTGLRNVLELARSQPKVKLSFFSSSEIYGDPDRRHIPTSESYKGNVSNMGERSCYDISKRLGETLVHIYHGFGVHANVIRPFNIFGPGMQKTDYRVLPNFASRIMSNHPLNIYGTGNQTRTFCYVTDAIRGFLQVLVDGLSGEPYNIGNPIPEISMLELAKEIGSILNKDIKVNVIEYPDSYPADEPNRRCPDITKAKMQLGYEPKVSLREGLTRFLQWAQQTYND